MKHWLPFALISLVIPAFSSLAKAPAAPTHLQAQALLTSGIRLSWLDNSKNETGFKVFRAPDDQGQPGRWAQIATVAANVKTFNDRSVSANRRYWYRVRAYHNNRDSDYSNSADARTFPLPPTNLAATPLSATRIELSWNPNANGQTGFKLERAPNSVGNPGNWTNLAMVAGDQTTFSDAGLAPDTTYWYRVRAYNQSGDSAYGSRISAKTFPVPPLPPLPPTNLSPVPVSATKINLSWTPGTNGQTGFKIERAADSSGSPGIWAQIATVAGSQTNFGDSELSAGATYWYRVGSYNSAGDSAYSSPASAMTPCELSLNAWGMPHGMPSLLTGVVAIAAGGSHSLALKSDGTVAGWGDDLSGEVNPPTNLTGVVAIAAGGSDSLALRNDGTVVGWGDDSYGQISGLTNLAGVAAIAAGAYHSLVLKSDGTVVGWGDDSYGQISGLTNLAGVVAIAAGTFHSLALKSDGTVIGCGYNDYGQSTPPADLTGVVAIAAGASHNLALKNDGTVFGWGYDYYGQARPPTNLTGVVAIAAGAYHSLALKSDGMVVGWGANDSGQIAPDGLTGRVTAIAGGGDFSLGITAAPTAPSGGHANILATNSLRFLWADNSPNEDGFRIQRAPDNGNHAPGVWAQLGNVPANALEYTDSEVVSNATYWYRIQSYNACGDSPWSLPLSVSVIPPPVPYSVSGVPGVAGLDLFLYEFWPNVDGFRIERANDANGSPGAWVEIATIGTTNSSLGFQGYYNDLAVLTNTYYWYRVRAFNALGNSGYNAATQVGVVTPPMPDSLYAYPFADQARLSWYNTAAGVLGFKIQRAPDNAGAPGTWSQIATVGPTNLQYGYYYYSDPGRALNSKYWYRVLAFNWIGDSPFSSPTAVTIVPPARPDSLVATVGNTNQAIVSWYHGVGDQDGFRIERAPDNGGAPGAWGEIGIVNATNTNYAQFTDTNVVANTKYWYRVRAFNVFGNSPYSSAIRLNVAPPPRPSDFYADVSVDTVNLWWSTDFSFYGYVDGYTIWRAPDVNYAPGVWTQIATVGGFISSYTDTNRALNSFWYRVRAFNWVGESSDSALARVTIAPPASPLSLSARIGSNNAVDLSWEAGFPSDQDGFKIERASETGGNPGTWTEIGTVFAQYYDYGEFADTNVIANTTNWYRVRAFNVLGNSNYSPPFRVAVVPPVAPSVSIRMFSNQFNLSWSADYHNYGSVDGFSIEKAPDSGGAPGTWTLIATIGLSVTNFTDPGAAYDTTYWYRVRAFNWVGDGPYSPNIKATIFTPWHRFTGITVAPDSAVTLQMDGNVSNMFNLSDAMASRFNQMFDLYVVDTSTNLMDWTRFDMVLRTNNDPSPLFVRDTNASRFDKRFYRTFTNQLPTYLPRPTGPFMVGTVDRVMIDPTRTNLYRYNPPTNAFMVTFWYPADVPPAGTLPALEWDPLFVASNPYWRAEPRWVPVFQKTVQHAFVGLPMTTNGGMFPVVLLSHGLGSFRKTFQPLVAELTSHGYVVVAVDHSDCHGSEFPDGRFLRSSGGDVGGRLKDMQFLLGKLTQMNINDPLFAGRLDVGNVGVFGHSYGGMVIETSRTNSQVKAAAIYDAINFVGRPYKPLLVALGQGNSFYSQDLALFNNATNNAVFFQLAGADHNTCTDDGWISISGRTPNRAFTDSLLWFFDRYLKGQNPMFPTNAVMYNLQMK